MQYKPNGMQGSSENDYKLRVLKRSAIAISSVVFVEVVLGLIVGSLAIISDGLHASLDALTILVLFIVTRASLKPPDEEHMYGHEKFEAIGGLMGGIALIGIALLIIYEALMKVLSGQTIDMSQKYVGFIAIGYTLCIDFFRVGTHLKARGSESSTMKAGFYHALADLSSTVIAFLGFGLATLGFSYGDSIASIILGILLSYLSVRLVWSSGMELSDTISKDLVERIRKEILATKGIQKCENLRVRKVGAKIFIEATVPVSEHISLEEAHTVASKIETNVQNSLGNVDVRIHVEPSEKEMGTKRLVEELATEVKGVKEAHEISAVHKDGKHYIILHAYVHPKLSVLESHKIAENIEKKIKENIKDIGNVTVHMEPFNIKMQKETIVNDDLMMEVVQKIAEQCGEDFQIKDIVTYGAHKKMYVNIDCCFTEHVSIEDAHKIASQIENEIKEHFAETIVTVHIEPERK
jgi:cation diffusion facilitator family transporter